MRYAKPLTVLLPTLLLAGACASSPVVLTPAAPCSTLIPAGWTEGVPSAPLPSQEAGERGWMAFGVEQTGKLRTANGRTSDVIGIVRACEARDVEVVRDIQRPWWRWRG